MPEKAAGVETKNGFELYRLIYNSIDPIPANPEFHYTARGIRYGVGLAELDRVLSEARAGMIVIRDVPTGRDVITRLPTVKVVPVFILASEAARRGRLERSGFDGGEVRIRLEADSNLLAHYDDHDDYYRELLENNGTVTAYELTIKALFDRYLLG